MDQPRRNRGFERVGRVPAGALGLPRARARELLLEAAWLESAGEVVAKNARILGLRRGVLTIEAAERRWATALEPMLPELGGRLLAARPGLGIKKLRLVRPDGETVVTLDAARLPAPRVVDPPAGPPDPPEAPPAAVDLEQRLREVERQYLARRARSEGAPGGEE